MSLKGVVKVTQVSNKGCILFEGSREGVEYQLKGGCSRLPEKEGLEEALWCTLFEKKIVEDY